VVGVALGGLASPAAALPLTDVPAQADVSYLPSGGHGRIDLDFGASGVGDVNGDGFDDVALDAFFANRAGGGAVVALGGPRRMTIRVESDAGRVFEVRGAAVSGPAGDVNGDGVDDLLARDPEADQGRGAAYVIFGQRSADPTDVDVENLAARGVRITGAPGDRVGSSVTGAGDVNRDGLDDVAVTAITERGRGYAAIVFGSRTSAAVELSVLGGRGYRIDGLCAGYFRNSNAGTEDFDEGSLTASLARAGDLNRDGMQDLLIGLGREADELCPGRGGRVLVVYGKRDTQAISATRLGGRGIVMYGPEGTGTSVAGAGDVNGDRRPDVIVPTGRGAAVVFDLRAVRTVRLLRAPRRTLLVGGSGDSVDDTPVSSLGDVNGDGLADFGMGVHVLRGQRSKRDRTLRPLRGGGYAVRLTTSGAAGFAAGAVARAGDVNGDGRADVLVPPTSLGPSGTYVLWGLGPPLAEVGPFRSRVFADRRGRIRLRVLCPGNTAGLCRGRVHLSRRGATVLRRSFRAAAGSMTTVAGRLPYGLRRVLRRGGTAEVRAVAVARDARGLRGVSRRTLSLLAKASPP